MSALALYFLLAVIGTPAALYVASDLAPDEFTLNASTYVPDMAWNARYPRMAEKLRDDAFVMDSSSTVILSSPSCSQYFFECTPVVNGRPDFSVRLRTTRTELKEGVIRGVECSFRNDSMFVYDGKRFMAAIDSVHWGAPERLLFINYAGDVIIIKGCRTLYHGSTSLPAADGIVFSTSASTSLVVRDIVRIDAEKWWDKRVENDYPVIDRSDNAWQPNNPLIRIIR